jgi:hypothetical protein
MWRKYLLAYLVINLLNRKAVTYEGGRLAPMEDDPPKNPSETM